MKVPTDIIVYSSSTRKQTGNTIVDATDVSGKIFLGGLEFSLSER